MVAFPNSFIDWPNEPANSGNFFAPNRNTAMTKAIRRS
jgi:hypothetical protein